VHDEIILEVKIDKVNHYKNILENCMKEAAETILKKVPAKADASVGDTWATEKNKLTESNCSKKVKKSSRSHKKQVGWQNRFYTLAEVENMPLLRFKEIWVILKDNKYVYDSLNHKEKKLFSLTPSSSQAQYFTCHETARCTMLTLRGVVGPGFKLMRMFIENKNP
jgi:hypothetical protein